MATPQDVMKMVKENDAKFVDFRFTDTRGKEQHVTVPVSAFDEDKFENGHAFDGSSIAGWKGIQASDMQLMPDPDTAYIDPFFDETTVVLSCDVVDPADGRGYDRDPRSIAKRAEAYLKSSGIGDTAYFGPEPEFFIFDGVEWSVDMSGCNLKIHSAEAAWNSGEKNEGNGATGHRPGVKGGYFPVPPVDSLHDIRSAMVLTLEALGVPVEVHHHEVANAGQCEIGTVFSTLVKRADWTQILKYVVHNVAHQYGKTATFMPKPIVGDNGSGMHVHQSIWKDGKNLFAGDGYAGLSETALFYIGGIIKHAKALNAITGEQVLAVLPDGLVNVHTRTVVANDRLRHEGGGLAVLVRDIVGHVLLDLGPVGALDQRAELGTDFALAGVGHFVVMDFDRHAQRCERQDHGRADVVQAVDRRHREVAALDGRTVTGGALAFVLLASAPGGFSRVDLQVAAGHVDRPFDAVEDEEFGFRTEVGGVAQA